MLTCARWVNNATPGATEGEQRTHGHGGDRLTLPPPPGALMMLGQLYTELNQHDQATAVITSAITAFGGATRAPADALYTLGKIIPMRVPMGWLILLAHFLFSLGKLFIPAYTVRGQYSCTRTLQLYALLPSVSGTCARACSHAIVPSNRRHWQHAIHVRVTLCCVVPLLL